MPSLGMTPPTKETVQEHLKRFQLLKSQGATEQTNPEVAHLAQLLNGYKVWQTIHRHRH